MKLEDIRYEKQITEDQIRKIIQEFQNKTSLYVEEITISRHQYQPGIEMKVTLYEEP